MIHLDDSDLLRQQCLINGQWVDAPAGKTIDVRNPANGQLLAQVPSLGAEETRTALAGAEQAWSVWKKTPAKSRARLLRRWYELVMEHQEDLARILTNEQGKPLAEARAEIAYGASYIEWFSEEAKRAHGDVIPHAQSDRRLLAVPEPIGVCAAITPWNFPCAMVTRKIAPALAAGCTLVLKPDSRTPLSALALARLAERAGIPAGVFSVVTGDAPAIGGEMCASHIVRKLTFTGSTSIGRLLMAQCAPTIKKLSLELGGNAPFIVFDDADLDAAITGAIQSKFRNAGQTCVCSNRIYVQSGIYDAFVQRFAAEVAKLKVSNGLEVDSQLGPLIDEKAVEKVEHYLADCLAKGGHLVTGGQRHPLGGHFYTPTVIANANARMLVAKEEIFGPLAPVFQFETEQEVIATANDTEFGLASYVFSRDLARVFRVAEALENGMIGINTGEISNEAAPFGGVKQSGLGREGSQHGLQDYMEIKYLCIAGIGLQ